VADPSETTQVSTGPEVDTTDVLDAIRELSSQVGGLQAEVNALRAQAQPLPAKAVDTAGWDGEPHSARDSLAWVRAVDSPGFRRQSIPWLLLEITFIAAVSVAVTVADLEVVEIVAVIAGAWAIVALAEWTAARAARRRVEAAYAPLAAYGASFLSDPSWFAPPVERTALEALDEEDTGARLPPTVDD
jgi:hypothetical protein